MTGQRASRGGGRARRRRDTGATGGSSGSPRPDSGRPATAGAGDVSAPGACPTVSDLALRHEIEAAGRGDSLVEEVGALRVVLLRLLAERGDDPLDLAASIPRVVNATVRALQARRALAADKASDLTDTITTILQEMGLGE